LIFINFIKRIRFKKSTPKRYLKGMKMKLILKKQEWIKGLVSKEDGVTAIEYGLIASLIAVIIIGAVTTVGNDLVAVFNRIATALTP
jgi:pilus assembly protein Flp/PilA